MMSNFLILLFKGKFANLLFFSGGHFNPAVTLGVMLNGGITISLGVMYVISQLLGGMLGAAFTRVSLTFFLLVF